MERKFNLHLGNCLDVLKEYPDNYVDSVVTDPPYGLTQNKKGGTGVKSINPNSPAGRSRIGTGNGAGGFMGEKWDSDVPSVEIWAECLRVLKPGGNLLCFAGTRTQHRMVARVVEGGFELQDIVLWCYGSGFPKSHDVSKAIDAQGGKDISWFPAWLQEKREAAGLSRDDLAQHEAFRSKSGGKTGCVWNWEHGIRTPSAAQFNELCRLVGHPEVSLEEVRRQFVRERRGVTKTFNPGSTEIVGPRHPITAPATEAAKKWDGWGTALKPAWEPISIFTKDGPLTLHADFKRLYYCAKASKKERNLGLVDRVSTHPTVKPLKLMEQLCELATPKGGVILDPFMGSGTTGIAALNLGFNFVGIEMGEEYFDIAKTRLDALHGGPQQ